MTDPRPIWAVPLGRWGCVNWMMRKPLDDQWRRISDPDDRIMALRWWIRISEHDAWTYDQLAELLAWHLDVGQDPPRPLTEWAHRVAAKHRSAPTKPGRRSKPEKDIKVLAEFMFKKLVEEKSDIRSYTGVGERVGRAPSSVRSAVERAGRWPPGTR